MNWIKKFKLSANQCSVSQILPFLSRLEVKMGHVTISMMSSYVISAKQAKQVGLSGIRLVGL